MIHSAFDTPAVARLGMVTCGLLLFTGSAAADERVNEMLRVQQGATAAARQAQTEINGLADETQEAISEYRIKLQELDRIRRYNDNLQRTINDQEREKASLTRQIDEFGDLEQGIVPLMMDMVDDMDRFVSLDVPFSIDSRRARMTAVRDTMDRSDVSIAEKYRNVMNSYMIEADAGGDMFAYAGELEIDGVSRNVDFLSVGRVLLAYQTPDRERTGYWDTNAREWRALDSSYRSAITLGIRMANRLAPPDILTLPVAAPKEEQS